MKLFSLIASALFALGLTINSNAVSAATVAFDTAIGSNPLVVSGPTEVFVTKVADTSPNGMTFRYVFESGGSFFPAVIIAGTELVGATDSFAVPASGQFLWDFIGGSGVGTGGVMPDGGLFGPFTYGFELKQQDAALLTVFSGGTSLAQLGLGLGDTYAALITPSNGGGGNGPSPIPLPAAAWLLISGFGLLGFLGRRRRSAPA